MHTSIASACGWSTPAFYNKCCKAVFSFKKSAAHSRHKPPCDATDVIYWLCAGHSSQMLLVDQSHVLIKQLLYDPLPDPALRTNSSQVSEWLFGFTQLKIPVTALFYQHTSTISQQQLAPQDDAASAVVTLTELLQTAPRLPYSTEMHTSVYVCNFVGSVWGSLTMHSPTNLKYNLLLYKASQLRNVSSHAIAPKSRPDTMLAAESCTLLLGEDKHIDLMAAYEDLNRKRVDLSGMHYGPLKFMLGYVAAGTTVQWCFIPSNVDQVSLLYMTIRLLLCEFARMSPLFRVLYFSS